MPTGADPSPPGNTTLEELERFRAEIERQRARRKAVNEEFEGFIRSFKTPAAQTDAPPHVRVSPPVAPAATATAPGTPVQHDPPSPPPVQAVPVRAPLASAPVAPQSPGPAPMRIDPRPPVSVEPQRIVTPDRQPTSTDLDATHAQTPRSRRGRLAGVVVAAGVLLVAIIAWQVVGRPSAPESVPAIPTATAQPPATPTPAAQTPAPAPGSDTVLTTTRAVWLRVVADGERIISRELPADARVPLNAEKTIEIRAGDAGAVRLSIRGRDQGALGRDGEVVTRSFTVPAR